MNTVNVIEISDTGTMSINQLVAFPDTPNGNAQAEELFKALVHENASDPSQHDTNMLCEDGYFSEGTYYCAIIHSTADKGEYVKG